ncbi:unnamed protein product [Paramecium primaurelia]|uniref:Uncharacterized protein n=1 Tax=Paramecium primaurelia TaxID=5886 RepID=A0A8S1KW74_PARPR|nr:unnamed protein product [Paramecium primaurelia]
MLQSHDNGTTNQEYKRVVEKCSRYLNERSKLKHQSNDKLCAAVRKIYLNPLLPLLQSDHEQSTYRMRRRQSSLLKDQYLHFKQESIEKINGNIQQQIVNQNSYSVPKKQQHQSQANLETSQQQRFFIGLYKNQRIENQSQNITIKDLVQLHKYSSGQQQNITHLPQLQQPSNEINLSKYFVKKAKPKKISFDDISFTKKCEKERGNIIVRIDKMQVDEFSEKVIEYLLMQDIMRLFFQNSSVIQLKVIMLELFKGVYYEFSLNFEQIIAFFTTQQITYLEIFYIKYSISQVLLNANYNFNFVERALNQFEEYRYLLQKPIPFITKLFDNIFYSNVVIGVMMKLLKSPAYKKFLTNKSLKVNNLQIQLRMDYFLIQLGNLWDCLCMLELKMSKLNYSNNQSYSLILIKFLQLKQGIYQMNIILMNYISKMCKGDYNFQKKDKFFQKKQIFFFIIFNPIYNKQIIEIIIELLLKIIICTMQEHSYTIN